MSLLIVFILLILLFFAVWQDLRSYRIPNKLVLTGVLIGLSLNALLPMTVGGLGFQAAFLGLCVGLIILMPLYILNVMGAGDIKLMAMIGAFVGPGAMLWITLYVLIAGGVLAIGVSLLRGRMMQVVDNLKLTMLLKMAKSPGWRLPIDATAATTVNKLPYGVAIASGTIVYLLTV